jgi:hypothetical protein
MDEKKIIFVLQEMSIAQAGSSGKRDEGRQKSAGQRPARQRSVVRPLSLSSL